MGLFSKTPEEKIAAIKDKYHDDCERVQGYARSIGVTLSELEIMNMITTTRMPQIPPESEARLQTLMKDRELQAKTMRLKAFKSMPASMRQYLIDALIWSKAISGMNNTQTEITQEEQALWDLKIKYEQIFQHIHSVGISYAYDQMMSLDTTPALQIEGQNKYPNILLDENVLSLEALLQAHSEQCADDSLSGNLDK